MSRSLNRLLLSLLGPAPPIPEVAAMARNGHPDTPALDEPGNIYTRIGSPARDAPAGPGAAATPDRPHLPRRSGAPGGDRP
jgi:hypothetical protein